MSSSQVPPTSVQEPQGSPQSSGLQDPSSAPLQQPSVSDFDAIERSYNAAQEIDEARASGNTARADYLIEQQLEDAFASDGAIRLAGGDPALDEPVLDSARVLHPDVAVVRGVILQIERAEKRQAVLDENNWSMVKDYRDSVIERFKEHNEAALEMDPELQAQQLRPLVEDPNMLADMRMQIVRMHNALREAGIEEGVWNDPQLAKIAKVISMDTETGAGYVTGGEQEYHPAYMDAPPGFKQIGWAATEVVNPAVSGLWDIGFNAGYGLMDLGAMAFEGLTGQDVHHTMPTVFLEDDNGNLTHNAGKLPSFNELASTAYAVAASEDLEGVVRSTGLSEQYASLRREGLDSVIHGASYMGGSVAGFMTPGGWAMAGGQALFKAGAVSLLKAERLAALSPWAKSLTRIVASTSGAAVGNGLFMGVTYGHQEGYGSAFVHGAEIAPLLLALGGMGRGIEKGLLKRAKMPKVAARAVSGGMEGAGFGMYEVATERNAFTGENELWSFIKDPTEEKWSKWQETMGINILAMMVFKSAMGTTPGQHALDKMAGHGPEVTKARVDEKAFDRDVTRRAEKEADVVDEIRAIGVEARRVGEQQAAEEGVASKLREAGKGIRERGEIEKGAEARGQRPQQAGMLGAGTAKDVVSRLERLITSQAAGGEQTEVGGVAAAGKIVMVTGERKTVDWTAEVGAVEREGGKRSDITTVHTHPSALSFSVADLKVAIEGLHKKPGDPPDFIVTAEGVQKVTVVGEPTGKAVSPWGLLHDRVNKRVAKKHGLDPTDLSDQARNRGRGEEVDIRYRAAVREIVEARLEWGKTKAESLGMKIETVEPGVDIPELGVSRGTMGDFGRTFSEGRAGRAPERPEPTLRTEARIERSGRAPGQRPEAARERLYEDVSSRGEYPAHGPAATPEGVPGTEPIHARDVIAESQVGPLTPAVRRKGMGQRKRWAHGYYNTREDLIRMEGSRDLNNLAHEWGHALWHQFGNAMNLSMRALESLIEVGKPTSTPRMHVEVKLHEGMAEFVARHLLGDTELAGRHPELYSEVMDFLSRPEQTAISEQFGRMEGAYQRWRDQGMLNQLVMSTIYADEPLTTQQAQLLLGKPVKKMTMAVKAQVAIRRAVNAFEVAMLDDMARVKAIQNKVFKAAGVDPDKLPITANPARMLDVVRGKSGAVMETFLFRHTMGFMGEGGPRGPSLRQALGEVQTAEMREFISYLNARRSLEALDKGMEAQLTREHYLLGVERFGNERFERAAQELKHWFDDIITYAVEGGAITEDAGKAIKGSWSVYVPFFRALEGPGKATASRGAAEKGSGIQRMRKGEQIEIRDPLEAALEVAQSIIQKAHQASTMKSFYSLHLAARGVGNIVTEVPRDISATQITFRQLEAALRDLNIPGDYQHIAETFADALNGLSAEDALGMLTIFGQKTVPDGSRPIVAFVPRYTEAEIARFEPRVQAELQAANGKLKWLEFDKEIYDVVMDVDPHYGLQHPILNALAVYPTTLVKLGATVLNPEFIGRNLARDAVLNSLFTDVKSRSRFVPVLGAASNFVAGLTEQFGTERQAAELFRNIGGMQATLIGREILGVLPGRSVANPSTPVEVMRKVVSGFAAPEATLRIREFKGAYDRALERGKTELEAILEALEAGQEVTTNFIRGGTVARAASAWLPYFNAGIQGSRKFLRHTLGFEGSKKQKQAIAQGLYNITLPSFMLWMLYKDDEEIQDLPPWRKLNYWTMRVPFTNELMSIPKPFEAGKIFGNIPDVVMEQFKGRPVELSEAGWDVTMSFVNGFQFVPSIIGPTWEAISNYSFFRGREIVPDWMEEGRLPKDQHTSFTTGSAKLIGKALGLSPAKIDYWVSGQTGGMGLTFMRWMDVVTGMGPEQKDPGMRMADVPFVGTFFRQQPHRQSRMVQQVYDLHRRFNQLAGSGELTATQAGMRPSFRMAKEMISDVKRMARSGAITQDEANRRNYEIAKPVIEAYERLEK